MICEECGNEHDGSYGSGRFCSKKCSARYAVKNRISIERLNQRQCDNVASCKLNSWLLKHGVKENRCEICGISEWMGQPLVCELHHVDGNPHNNSLSNLIMVCPNCHSQTETYKNKKRV